MTRDQLAILADVLVLGPFMAWNATQVKHPYFRAGLTVVALGTIALGLYRLAESRRPAEPELAGMRRRLRARAGQLPATPASI